MMPTTTTRSRPKTVSVSALRPFDPKRVPFFYGWLIVGIGTLGVVMSVPGQTLGVSVFTDFLTAALGLSRVRLSIAYLVGTVSSALILSHAGRLYDRFGARVVTAAAACGLGLVLVYLTRVDYAARATARLVPGIPSWTHAFVFISIGFFGIRFFGQGVLTMASNNMVVKWFDKRRGLAVGIVGIFMAFGFSAAPRLLDALIAWFGWRNAWVACAATVGLFFTGVVLLLYRDNPEQCGMTPDGPLPRPRPRRTTWKRRASHPERDFTLAEARRTFPFWVIGGALLLFALYMTGLTFHVVSIFSEAGLSRTTAVSIFFPASIITVVIRFGAGLISDYIKLKYLLIGQLAGVLISAASLAFLGPAWSVAGVIVGNGITGGLVGLLAVVTWPQFYGRTHLGAITGFVMAMQVAGSAVGPYVFSLSLSKTGGYAAAALACVGAALVLLVLGTKAEQPTQSGVSAPANAPTGEDGSDRRLS